MPKIQYEGPQNSLVEIDTEGNMTLPTGATINGQVLSYSGQLDIFVDPSGGSDTNDGSMGSPLATLAEVERRVPLLNNYPTFVHQKPGAYVWPQWRSRMLNAPIIHYADDVWDQTVYTTVISAASVAGTGVGVVTSAGLAVDAHRQQWIEMTSGAAAGHRKMIRNNTATDIIPVSEFSVAPAPGDTFRIFTSAVNVSLATVPAGDNAIVLAAGVGRDTTRGREGAPGVFVFAGINFTGSVRVGLSAPCVMYGCTFVATQFDWSTAHPCYFGCDSPTSTVDAVIPFAQLGAPSITAWRGWGVSFITSLTVSLSGGLVAGYWSNSVGGFTASALTSAGVMQWVGGVSGGLSGVRYGVNWEVGTRLDSTGTRFDGTGTLITMQQGAQLALGRCQAFAAATKKALVVETGAEVRMSGSGGLFPATGESPDVQSVDASLGGRVYLIDGAVSFGRAAGTDFDVGNGAPQNKAFFAAATDHIAHTDGSSILRSG